MRRRRRCGKTHCFFKNKPHPISEENKLRRISGIFEKIFSMKLPSVFLSYNPFVEPEETLAMRLHTLGGVNGFQMLLPDRFRDNHHISPETQRRINIADYFILFSTKPELSQVVLEEINYAWERWHDKGRILVIYDMVTGRTLAGAERCTEIFISRAENMSVIAEKVQNKLNELRTNTNGSRSVPSPLERILLAGLGIWLLDSLVAEH